MSIVRSEWLKLRTVRSNVTLAIVAILLPLAITLLTAVFIKIRDVDDSTIPAVLLGSGTMSVLLMGVVGVLVITQEYSQGTIRLTFAATPHRSRVYMAKIILLFAVSIVVTSIVQVVGSFGGKAILNSRGFHGAVFNDQTTVAFIAMTIVGVLVSFLGLAIGTFTRNPPFAITTLVLWPLLIEGIVGGLLSLIFGEHMRTWLPFSAGLGSMQIRDHFLHLGRWGSVGYFGAWVVGISLIAHTVLRRRDA